MLFVLNLPLRAQPLTMTNAKIKTQTAAAAIATSSHVLTSVIQRFTHQPRQGLLCVFSLCVCLAYLCVYALPSKHKNARTKSPGT